MEYLLNQNQIVRKLGQHQECATILIPPFRCKSLSIDFFCELADNLSIKSTCYHMDYSYMKKGHCDEYTSCLPTRELSEILELASDVSKKYKTVNLVGMCLGAAFSLYISQQIPFQKIAALSIVDFENFRDFLIGRYESPVAILPEESKEYLVITKERADWYKNRKTQDLIAPLTAQTLFVCYDKDPFVYSQNRQAIFDAIAKNKKCVLEILHGENHRLTKDKKQVFALVTNFLFG